MRLEVEVNFIKIRFMLNMQGDELNFIQRIYFSPSPKCKGKKCILNLEPITIRPNFRSKLFSTFMSFKGSMFQAQMF